MTWLGQSANRARCKTKHLTNGPHSGPWRDYSLGAQSAIFPNYSTCAGNCTRKTRGKGHFGGFFPLDVPKSSLHIELDGLLVEIPALLGRSRSPAMGGTLGSANYRARKGNRPANLQGARTPRTIRRLLGPGRGENAGKTVRGFCLHPNGATITPWRCRPVCGRNQPIRALRFPSANALKLSQALLIRVIGHRNQRTRSSTPPASCFAENFILCCRGWLTLLVILA